jgi:hypothetical protein
MPNDPGNKNQNLYYISFLYTTSTYFTFVHFAKDFYSPAEVYSSVTILFIVVACFQFATNGKSSCW